MFFMFLKFSLLVDFKSVICSLIWCFIDFILFQRIQFLSLSWTRKDWWKMRIIPNVTCRWQKTRWSNAYLFCTCEKHIIELGFRFQSRSFGGMTCLVLSLNNHDSQSQLLNKKVQMNYKSQGLRKCDRDDYPRLKISKMQLSCFEKEVMYHQIRYWIFIKIQKFVKYESRTRDVNFDKHILWRKNHNLNFCAKGLGLSSRSKDGC